MPTSFKLVSVHNTTELTLEVFQTQDAIQVFQANAANPVAVCPALPIKVCKSAEDYIEHPDENQNLFFCIRDKNNVHTRWMRLFDPEGHSTKIALVHSGRNSYAQKFSVASTVTDDRPHGLYVKVEWRDDFPSEGKILWVVGEIVTDILGDG